MSAFFLLQTAKGSIQGVVVNAVTNKPIAGAQVTGTRIPSPPVPPTAGGQVLTGVITGVVGGIVGGGQANQLTPAKTDANGQFVFHDLEPGTYLLRATAEGYAQQDYSNRPNASTGNSSSINLTSGQSASGTVLHLTPGGTVSGRVTGPNGEPLVNIEVSLLRSMYNADGVRTFQQSATVQTNDRGEYRMFWVTPGRYFLSAASSNRPIPGVAFNPAGFSNKYQRMFYPASTDISSATSLEIPPASEVSAIDFRLSEQPTFRVRGRVVTSAGGAPPRSVGITIMPRDSAINSGGLFSTSSPYNPADGTFELRDVPAGSYLIRAQQPVNGPPQPGQPPVQPPVAVAPVDVSGADVEGVVLNFTPPIALSGRIRIEGESSLNVQATVMLRPASAGPFVGPIARPTQTNADGTFKIDGVSPGEYRLTVNAPFAGNQASMYVKEMRLGATDLNVQPLVVAGPVSDSIEVTFGKDAGQITGTVRTASQQLAPNMQVVLVPDQRPRRDLYKFVLSNSNGQFVLRSVPPGSYKIFAWENIDQNSWMDPAVLAGYESLGLPVIVNPSSNLTPDVKVIPAAR